MYTLKTENLPLLSKLKGWKYGFESPFKAEVYFLNTKQFTDQKWGTPNPIMLRDNDFGAVRIRAFGSYTMRINDPVRFLQEISGTDNRFETHEISNQLKAMVISKFTTAVGESKIPVLDIAASYDNLAKYCQKRLSEEFATFGIEMTKFVIVNISLPQAVEEAIDKRSSMGMLGVNYTQMQQADAMKDAAKNPTGGVENLMGMAMMQQMMNLNQQQTMYQQNHLQQFQQQMPPPAPPLVQYFVSINGQQAGPFDQNALRQMIAQNQLTPNTYVWKQGMSAWQLASQVADIANLFSFAPPPPPPM